ncbi:MAG: hypothetical protein DLM63_05520 [Solirubrobacterales bacterium]|nr:MAG: hypothetical protein DLM63_05520 [Solirubrobacterales bacterium]
MARKARGAEAADAVRGAVDRTFQATVGQAQITRERAQELVDELTGAAGRVRAVLDDVLVQSAGDDLRSLREELRALERRVRALEGGAAPKRDGAPVTRGSAANKKREPRR